jgi:hypothetical protein
VLSIDTFEMIAALDPWFRNDLVPSLPDGTLVVIASRELPDQWRLDPGLAGLVEVIGLRNLSPDESCELLARRGVDESRRSALSAATHGHPLALALVADLPASVTSTPSVAFRFDAAPDVVRALLDCVVREVPSPAHRHALYLCAEAFATTEELLRAAFGSEASGLFDWLRGLSCVQHGPRGLFPHDLARDVISAELRTREPEVGRSLHRAALAAYLRRAETTPDRPEQVRTMLDAIYLHRHNPAIAATIDVQRLGTRTAEPLQPADRDVGLALVRERSSEVEAEVVARYMTAFPTGISIYRDTEREPYVIAGMFELDRDQLAIAAGFDPAIEKITAYLRRTNGLRAQERVGVLRFMHGRPQIGANDPAYNEVQARSILLWAFGPRFAWSFAVIPAGKRGPTRWHALFEYSDFHTLDGMTFELGPRTYDIVGHDWRSVPRDAWIERFAESAWNTAPGPRAAAPPRPVLALTEPEFRVAVRAVLKNLSRDDVLAKSALVQSRLVREAARGASAAATLRALIIDATRTLEVHPRDHKLARVLGATFIDPAETQELAAERLALPFSTYRRHLTTAIERITDWLWQREIQDDR